MNLFDQNRAMIGTRPALNLDGVSLSAAVPSPYVRIQEPDFCVVEFMAANSPTSGEYVTSQVMQIEELSGFIRGYIEDPEGTLSSLGWKWKGTVPTAGKVDQEKSAPIRANVSLKDFFKKRAEGAGGE